MWFGRVGTIHQLMVTSGTAFGKAELLKVFLHDVWLPRKCDFILKDLLAFSRLILKHHLRIAGLMEIERSRSPDDGMGS